MPARTPGQSATASGVGRTDLGTSEISALRVGGRAGHLRPWMRQGVTRPGVCTAR